MDSFEDDDVPMLVPDEQPAIPDLKAVNIKSSVPVTIITGFLGSGKTTLIMNLLNSNLKRRIAVILNEYGASTGIDKSLSLKDGKLTEEWLELPNGCLCCSVKDSGVRAIETLIEKNTNFDYVLLETTGLADPGPIASLFWLDEALQSKIHLDAIVTVVDSKFILDYLNQVKSPGEINEATKQIALADRIILNKTDLISANEQQVIKNTILAINSTASIIPTVKSVVPIELILDLHCFDNKTCDPFKEINNKSVHTLQVSTVTFTVQGNVDRDVFEKWIQDLLWEGVIPNVGKSNHQILRSKGILNFTGENKKHILQAVQQLYDIHVGAEWDEARMNKLVFIGSFLDEALLKESFCSSCLHKSG